MDFYVFSLIFEENSSCLLPFFEHVDGFFTHRFDPSPKCQGPDPKENGYCTGFTGRSLPPPPGESNSYPGVIFFFFPSGNWPVNFRRAPRALACQSRKNIHGRTLFRSAFPFSRIWQESGNNFFLFPYRTSVQRADRPFPFERSVEL